MSITPFSTPQELADLAAAHPELGAAIAQHPHAYDGLLDWLAEYGDEAARAAVRARRSLPAAPDTMFRPAPAPGAVVEVSQAAAPPRRRLPAMLGIAAGIAVLGVAAAFAVGPIQGMFAGGPPRGNDPATTDPSRPESFDLADAPVFADGIDVAWQLSLDELQTFGEDRGFYDYADYGDFWLVSSYDSRGDLTHGGWATAVDAATGKVLWALPDGGSERACANRLIGGRLICAHADNDRRVIESIDPGTGEVTVEPSPGFETTTVTAFDADSYLVAGFDTYESPTTRLARVRPGGKVEWTSELKTRCSDLEFYQPDLLSLQHADGFAVLNWNGCLGAILDPASGEVSDAFAADRLTAHLGGFSAQTPYCVGEYGNPDECQGAAARTASEATLPDGSRLPVRYEPAETYLWNRTAVALDPAPTSWYFVGRDDCFTESVIDAATGRAGWSSSDAGYGFCPMQVGDGAAARPALLVMDEDRTEWLTLLDPATGEPVWRTNTSALLRRQHDTFGYLAETLDDSAVVLGDDRGLNGFSAVDGRLLWRSNPTFGKDSWWRVVPGPQGTSLVAESGDRIARMVPAVAPTRVAGMPSGVPDCPRGWTPVSWSTWPGGHTLVCSAGSQATYYLEYVDGATVYRSNTGTATPTGWTWTPQPGHEVTISFSGVLLQVTADGTATSRFPAQVWHDGDRAGFAAPPADLTTCPAGSWPLSLSVWEGGWLLICGTAADQPNSLQLAEGATVRQGTEVTSDGSAYCGQVERATVCAYPAPALVSVRDPGGEVTQHSVTENWFAQTGRGGEGEGEGSYGVEAPDATAADQLRYIDEILARSKAARKTLSPAINDVLGCTKLDSAIKRIDAVTANREELLDALESTPVDALPQGPRLVADLQQVLELSRATDQAYADWAREERANGCAGGSSSPAWQRAKAADDAVDGPKNAFVDFWNTEIAPAYGVRELTNSDI